MFANVIEGGTRHGIWFWMAWGILAVGGWGAALAQQNTDLYPQVDSVKGLQVQMVDDALELGIRHAALNIDLGSLIAPDVIDANDPQFVAENAPEGIFFFRRSILEQHDRTIKALSDRGIIVSLILLNYVPAEPQAPHVLVHPAYDPACPNRLAAFNTQTEAGRNWLSATVSFLAKRWSRDDQRYGRVWNWIVGNEVNSHWFWCNRGQVDLPTFTRDYLAAVQLVHRAVRRHSQAGRVFVSLEHHWNERYAGGTEQQTFPGRAFLDEFSRQSREQGDFDWHLAFHPYPENLFEPRTWLDRSATDDWRTSPRITFRNLEVLLEYLDREELRVDGKRRRVILSEQGFHTPDGAAGEDVQAAAYCYAWKKVQAVRGIDAFILHRHVDHAHEGGLRLGLWTRQAESVATPERRKKIYSIFQAAGTDRESAAFAFALPIIGWPDWSAVNPAVPSPSR